MVKRYLLLALALCSIGLVSCGQDSSENLTASSVSGDHQDQIKEEMTVIKVTVNQQTFEIILENTTAAKEFKALLPLTLNMQDVNANEKFATLGAAFTSDDQPAGQIKSGDVKLYAGDGLVIFYKDFNSSYAYTSLGRMSDNTGFAEALGKGEVTLTFHD